MAEATAAGLAAGIVAQHLFDRDDLVSVHKRLAILKDGEEIDMALIDAVVIDQLFVGSKAVWELSDVRQIVCTRADPKNVGLTSIAGGLHPIRAEVPDGVYLILGDGGCKVRAAVLPGSFQEIAVSTVRVLNPGDEVEVLLKPSIVALDGEREVSVLPQNDVRIKLQNDGPLVVDIEKVLMTAAEKGFFIVKD